MEFMALTMWLLRVVAYSFDRVKPHFPDFVHPFAFLLNHIYWVWNQNMTLFLVYVLLLRECCSDRGVAVTARIRNAGVVF